MPFMEGIPTVVVQLDKPRELGFTMGALRRFRERLGTVEIKTGADGKIGPEALLAIPTCVWVCLDAEGRAELSIEQVEEMVYPGNLQAIYAAIGGLFGASNPDPDDKEEGADQTPGPTQARPKLASTG